jgi:hypothetical protein
VFPQSYLPFVSNHFSLQQHEGVCCVASSLFLLLPGPSIQLFVSSLQCLHAVQYIELISRAIYRSNVYLRVHAPYIPGTMSGQSCACPDPQFRAPALPDPGQTVTLHIDPFFIKSNLLHHCACSHLFVTNMAEQMISVICVAQVPAAVSALYSCTWARWTCYTRFYLTS